MQLNLWGIDYFDLFLVHFPVALAYVDPKHRYPPEWWGDDKKSVNLRTFQLFSLYPSLFSQNPRAYVPQENTPFQETWGAMEELVDEGLVKNIGVRLVHEHVLRIC